MQSNSPTVCHNSSPSPRIALQPTTTKTGSSQQDELCDSSLVKSVSFFEETCPDTSKKSKVDLSQQHPKSSTVNIQPTAPPQTNVRKDSALTSHTSISTMGSVPTGKNNPPSVVTGSAVTVRPRSSSSKNSYGKQRTKSNLSIRNSSASPQSPTKIR